MPGRSTIIASVALMGMLGGCASTALRSYVGKDLDAVAQRYGPPTAQIHLPDGTEGFQWVVGSRRTPAAAAPLTTFLPVKTVPLQARSAAADAGLLFGGMCIYTLLARRDEAAGSWKIVGYRTPRFDCD